MSGVSIYRLFCDDCNESWEARYTNPDMDPTIAGERCPHCGCEVIDGLFIGRRRPGRSRRRPRERRDR
jgi:hypothetical protein